MNCTGPNSFRRAAQTATYLVLAAFWGPLFADDESQEIAPRESYRSANVVLFTDLPASEAQSLLARLESTLDVAVDYWERPCKGTLQCYVARDVDQWHDRELPHPLARIFIGRVGGAVVFHRLPTPGPDSGKLLVFAAAREGIAEHELVHAYCGQAFGRTGPCWYREGMAQLLTNGEPARRAENLPAEILQSLREGRRLTVQEVVQSGQHVQALCDSLTERTADHDGVLGLIPSNHWTDANDRSLTDLQGPYAWSWLLCHLLEYNPNYRIRFRALGQDYLAGREDSFERLLGSSVDQLEFEFQFTASRLAPGYRVDLCAWDWSKRFRPLAGRRPVRVRIAAARGYQPSGVLVTAGQTYTCEAQGSWTACAHAGPTTADGDARGFGRLEAVILKDFQLSEPLYLGQSSGFTAPCDGQLYLRCCDEWHLLGDNDGSVVVTLARPR